MFFFSVEFVNISIQQGHLKDLPIALPQLTGAYFGEAIAKIVLIIFKGFNIL
jgi:hypothetical protein